MQDRLLRSRRAGIRSFRAGEEQRAGEIPRVDKDHLRTLETQTLSEMSESVRGLSENVSTLTTVTYRFVVPILLLLLGSVVAKFFV